MMLDEDADESLERAEDGAMQHHGRVLVAVFADIGRAEPAGHVQVDLQRAALPVAADGIAQHEFELGSVERALTRVVGVGEAGRLQRLQERRLGLVPDGILADACLGPVGELDAHVVEAEGPVNVEDQVADRDRLGRDLFGGAEDVRVVLGERAHAHHAVQRAGRFVAMTFAELAEAHGQVAVARDALLEDLHVARAVHGLDRVLAAVDGLGREHVVAEGVPVPRRLPQRTRHDLGRVDLAVAGRILLLPHEVDELLEQRPALRVPEDGAGRLLLEVEQVHDPAEPPVVALLGLLEHREVLPELLRVRPGRAVDALQHLVVRVAAPVGARHVGELERLAELARGGQVRAAAEVDEPALAVQRDGLTGRDALDDFGLVLLADAAEKLGGLVTVPDLALDRLVAIHDVLHALLDDGQVVLGERFFPREIVVEAVFDRGADRHLRVGPEFLDGLGQHVGRVVAEQLEAVLRVASYHLYRHIRFDCTRQVVHLAVDLDSHGIARQAGADAGRNIGSRNGSLELLHGSIG